MTQARQAIPGLTGVRGLAALWVFLTHVYGFAALVLHAPGLKRSLFLFNGFRGVDLFFVLSGFILMHVHDEQFVAIERQALRSFFLTRFFRVYPLNAAVLLAVLPLAWFEPSYVAFQRSFTDGRFAYKAANLSPAGFVQTLLLVQSWTVFKLGEWNIVSWTLSAEVLGYLLFPALAWSAMRLRSAETCAALAACSLAALTALLFLSHHANNNPTGTFGSVRMFFCFSAGILLHRCYRIAGDRLRPASPAMTIAAVLLIAATLFVPMAPVLDSFGFALLVIGLANRAGPVSRLLETRAALFMGRISFSFYLVHFLLIQIALWSLGGWLTAQDLPIRVAGLLTLCAICVGVAMLCYETIERPSQRLGRRMAGRPVRPAAAGSDTASA